MENDNYRHADLAVLTNSEFVVEQKWREVLDHFGLCPECGYTAHAFIATARHVDGTTKVMTVGSCGLPCGWSGPTEITKMTEN
ncbi:hypothetical protein [Nocardia sp. NPDC004860]|uniref:hypothetical protein n=1 Tax=Nocardia sp. NPDC004860 TaxID=3154557 RepID=UPI0033A6E511